MRLIVELLVQGLINGAIYALIAVGLAMVYGLLRILHVAHAGVFALGGYVGLVITNASGSFAGGVIGAMLVAAVCGALMYRFCYEPLLGDPPYVALIASVAIFLAMEEALRLTFGDHGLTFKSPPIAGALSIYGVRIRYAELLVMGLAVVLLGSLAAFARRTRQGIAWRATVSEPRMAESFGVDVRRVRYLAFSIGSALAAAAGVLVVVLNNVAEPHMGSVPSYKALAIIVLGGFGSVGGTLVAALVLGIIEAFGSAFLSGWIDRDSIAFATMLLVLLIRPQGLVAVGMRSSRSRGALSTPAKIA
ncbi:MAG: branched-chain amino acid ABC transporter permease [Pseudomonadota bacterium]|nr:branched-chain amino acid ABC transporter permease [Pseudomonadota bacterium]